MQVKGSAKDVGKNLDPSSSNLPNPSAAVDKAAGNAKGLAADAKQGAKNVASDLSENPLDGLADKVDFELPGCIHAAPASNLKDYPLSECQCFQMQCTSVHI